MLQSNVFRSSSVVIMAVHLFYQFHHWVRCSGVSSTFCSLPCTIIKASKRLVQFHPRSECGGIGAAFEARHAPSTWRVISSVHRHQYHYCYFRGAVLLSLQTFRCYAFFAAGLVLVVDLNSSDTCSFTSVQRFRRGSFWAFKLLAGF